MSCICTTNVRDLCISFINKRLDVFNVSGFHQNEVKMSKRKENPETEDRPAKKPVKMCSVEGCGRKANRQKKCHQHGGTPHCSTPGCKKFAQNAGKCKACFKGVKPRKGWTVGKTDKLCSVEGCGTKKHAQCGGYCQKHAPLKKCIVDGCEEMAKRSKCHKHGTTRCSTPDCEKFAQKAGKCVSCFNGSKPHKSWTVKSEVKIISHSAPEPIDLLANISVKKEPIEEGDVEMLSHEKNEPDKIKLLEDVIKVKLEPVD